ncbi:MAG: hypothetical protein AB7K68_02510 [Bacteriovoracia bacterium]
MKNKAWLFLLVLLCGSAATVSAFAYSEAENFPGGETEISNDEATTIKMDAMEAVEVCQVDCVKEETATCNALHDPTNHRVLQKCLKKVPAFCERSCN